MKGQFPRRSSARGQHRADRARQRRRRPARRPALHADHRRVRVRARRALHPHRSVARRHRPQPADRSRDRQLREGRARSAGRCRCRRRRARRGSPRSPRRGRSSRRRTTTYYKHRRRATPTRSIRRSSPRSSRDFLYRGTIAKEAVTVASGGYGIARYTRRWLRGYRPGQIMNGAYQYGAIGPDVGYAVGVAAAVQNGVGPQAAHKGTPVVCITGDAGFGYTAMEVETLQQVPSPGHRHRLQQQRVGHVDDGARAEGAAAAPVPGERALRQGRRSAGRARRIRDDARRRSGRRSSARGRSP